MSLTAKQEKFCQCVASEEMTLKDAYKKAYDADKMNDDSIYVEACELSKTPKISLRIAQLKALVEAKVVEELAYTKQEHLKELVEERKFAKSLENPSTSLKATELKGKLCGHYEDIHKHIGDKNNPIQAEITIKWK